MKKILIWDIPTRILHWTLAVSLTASLGIALLVDGESPLFQYHMIFGLVAVFAVALRFLLGLFGTRHSRFSNLPVRPQQIISYFQGVLNAKSAAYAGNNPGAACAALGMFILVPLIVITGLNIKLEVFEDLHAVLAYTLLALIIAHLAGLLLHTLRHRENISASMVTGNKAAHPKEGIPSAQPIVGIVILVALAAWTTALLKGHDSKMGTLQIPLLGTSISLGENEREEHSHQSEKQDRHGDDDKD